jgi:hypothetical protein
VSKPAELVVAAKVRQSGKIQLRSCVLVMSRRLPIHGRKSAKSQAGGWNKDDLAGTCPRGRPGD